MEKEKDINVKLLNDNVTKEDAFNAHNLVASAISKLINSNEDGKTIGLTGKWGSGKSSIIEMIKEKLKETCNSNASREVFVFDAWVHEGDPLRRSFLEEFIKFLIKLNYLNESEWKEKTDELTRKKEINTIKTRKYPTKIAIYFLLSTILALIFKEFISKWPNIEWWLLIISLMFFSSPLFILLYAMYKYHKEKGTQKLDYISIFTDKGIDKTESTSLKTIDPTSIEFQNIFKDIFENIKRKIDTKILIVIDNIDRVDEKDALKIWATMRTFLDFKEINYYWKKNLWLLIPFDKPGLERLWKNDKDRKCTVTSFTEKTFQITFETPLPILSDWKLYFENQFKHAFSNYSNEKEINKIFQIYDLEGRNGNLPPTPREIKIFINNLIASYLQKENDIPLHVQALYVILRKDKWKSDEKLISDLKMPFNEHFLEENTEKILIEDYRIMLASLYFNVNIERARYLLLGEDIINAIKDENDELILKIQKIQGFEIELNKIITSYFNLTQNTGIHDNFAIVAKNLGLIENKNSISVRNCFEIIKGEIENVNSWSNFNETMGKGIINILEFYKYDRDIIKIDNILKTLGSMTYLVDEVNSMSGETINSIKNENKTIEAIKGINIILKILLKNNFENEIKEHFKIYVKDEYAYEDLINIMVNNLEDDNIKYYYVPLHKFQNKINPFVQKIKSGFVKNDNYINILKFYGIIKIPIVWGTIVEEIINRLKIINEDNNEESKTLHHILVYITNFDTKSKTIAMNYSKSGNIFNFFIYFWNNNQQYDLNYIFFIILKYNNDNSIINNLSNSQLGKNQYDQIIINNEQNKKFNEKFLEFLIKENLIYIIFETNHQYSKKFIEEIFKLLLIRQDLIYIIPAGMLFKYENKIYNYSGENYSSLIENYVKHTDLVNITMNSKFEPDKVSLYISILDSENFNNNEFENYLIKGLNEIDKTTWKEAVEIGYESLYDLLNVLSTKNIKVNLKSEFEKAIFELLINLKSNNDYHADIKSYWPSIITSLSDSEYKIFKKDLIDELLSDVDISKNKLLDICGNDIIDSQIIYENADNIVRKLFVKILERKDDIELNWMKNVLTKCKDLENRCIDAFLHFKDCIKNESLKDLETNIENIIQEIAILANVKILKDSNKKV